MVFAVVGVVAVIAVVLSIVLGTRSGGSGDPEAVANRFAAGLAGNSSSTVQGVLCAGAFSSAADDLLGDVQAATVQSTSVSGSHASADLKITATLTGHLPSSPGSTEPNDKKFTVTFGGSLQLTKQSGRWCVSDFDAVPPAF